MLMPVGDDNSDRRLKPMVNYLLIAANIFIFVFFQGLGTNEKFTYAFSTVPQEIVSGSDIVTEDQLYVDPLTGERFRVSGLQETPISVYITLITSMFMHGGFTHIFGNMLFLMIFGDNIENRLGHLRYLIFYLLVGIIASLAHVFVSVSLGSSTLIPSLGASGAISGVLGGYLLLFPKRRVRVVMFYQIMVVPAIVAIGILGSSQGGGVAYGAHIGGFIAGFFLVKFFALGRR